MSSQSSNYSDLAEKIKSYKKFSWIVANFSRESLCAIENGKMRNSPVFSVTFEEQTIDWFLSLYPNGHSPEFSHNISIYLNLRTKCSLSVDIRYKFKIVGKSGGSAILKEGTKFGEDFIKGGWGFPKFISHQDLAEKADELIQDGKLKIICEIIMLSYENEYKPLAPLSDDIQKMFDDEIFTDFEFRCNDGEVLKCHKFILVARSPVFYAMLSSEMKEKQQGYVDIVDFDSKVMLQLLRFIYSFDMKVKDVQNVANNLVFAAEQYQLENLKWICIEAIIENLSSLPSPRNVIDALLVADKISDAEKLFKKCVDVILSDLLNVNEIEALQELPSHILTKVMSQLVVHATEVNF